MKQKKPVRITVDTNILVSMYVFPAGVLTGIMDYLDAGRCKMSVSEPIIRELCAVLRMKFGWEEENISRLAAQLRRRFEIVEPEITVSACAADPADDKILEAAIAFKADFILSGDKHLLEMKAYKGIRILNPAELMRRL